MRRAVAAGVALLLSASAAQAGSVVQDAFACASEDDLWAIIRFVNEGDQAAAQQFFLSRARFGQCRFLDVGETVAVIDSTWTGLVKVQPARGGGAVWTTREVVR